MKHQSVNNNTDMGLVIPLCSNSNHLISFNTLQTASDSRHLLSCGTIVEVVNANKQLSVSKNSVLSAGFQ